MANIDELKKRLHQELDDNDLDAVFSTTAKLKKLQAEEAEKAREARLAKARAATEELDSAVVQLVKQANVISALTALAQVYGKERNVNIIIPLDDVNAACVMPLEKARAGRTGGGGGTTKDQFGMSLADVFDQFASDEERKQMSTAEGGSAQWALKNRVKNRAIREGLIKTSA